MISIIIPVYNQAKKLARCLESIMAQTYQDYEVIIINDGSTDNPDKVFTKFEQTCPGKIKYFSQTNQGANVARNRGFKEAWGNYLFFCDADAVLRSDCLEILLIKLEQNPDKAYAYSSFRYGAKFFKVGDFSAEKLKQGPYIHTSALIRMDKFPGFDVTLKRFQDWDLWLSILELGGQGIWSDEVLFSISGGGTMSNWMPSFSYQLFPWLPSVRRYKTAMQIVKLKHKL